SQCPQRACGCSSSWSCWPTSGGASSTSTSPSIQPRGGRTTPRHPRALLKSSRRLGVLGRIRLRKRLVGSVRHECLDHVLVLNERHLHRIPTRYLTYYHCARTHLALEKDAPDRRPIERPEAGRIVQIPEVGGLHHRYVRRAA